MCCDNQFLAFLQLIVGDEISIHGLTIVGDAGKFATRTFLGNGKCGVTHGEFYLAKYAYGSQVPASGPR